ncbi:DUF1801 domain-containing protein [Cellulomonas humilata]|uniref:DUF1801 domain-containing protein n=1 Tax=Cellulomonas humilata TaxID=144055 RepID=A0A7Y6DXZ2_9CELL|nr:DUF1801 domain-containing protein [Cellulomonas humilata]NUU17890.1 DUF1801 domain-containing protein [Cellulomonas humilata]
MANDPNKTIPTDVAVDAFLETVENPVRRRDAIRLVELMTRVTGEQPRMWGPTIVGFGAYHYQYASGRQGDAIAAGFSPRKAAMTVYLADGVEAHAGLLADLGPHTTGASCLYIKNLDTIDLGVLEEAVRRSYATVSAESFGTDAG